MIESNMVRKASLADNKTENTKEEAKHQSYNPFQDSFMLL